MLLVLQFFSEVPALQPCKKQFENIRYKRFYVCTYILDAVGLSEILKAKQKLGVTFNFDKHDVIDFMKFSKMTMFFGQKKL